ncbi:ATP-binding cassette domain-containing protein [Lentibacillus sediminis]|uniref:ATP-binding cassette domain-containing protein n=1 Tax=Lentibacillus sediminis TaxID=1940529 RepID=UPI000C1C195B|nr:ABC transporter ATP-binding protein [Lentibacillus sediminis]
MQPFAEIKQVKKKVDEFHLGPVDLTIEPGTITALVGNNGSGKSTLLKLMMNLAAPDEGLINIFQKNVQGADENWKQQVAYQPQRQVGWDPFTGNALKDLISPLYPNWDEELFIEMISMLDVPLTKRYSKLSEGLQQKLTLALTVPRNAPLLLLDEPTTAMDIPSKKNLMDILAEWMDQGERAIIMASHQSENIMKLADYLYVLQSGKAIGHFEKEELLEGYKRYWFGSELPDTQIPGEVNRGTWQVISNQPALAEQFFREHQLPVANQAGLELEEVMTLLLTREDE